jgi:Glycine zipper
MLDKYIYWVGLICLLTSGCTLRQAGYTALGAGAGGGIGYSIHHNVKDAVIGGVGGALVGNLVGQWQDKSEKTKHDKSYQEGYNQAKVDVAKNNWDANTGKGTEPKKQLVTVMLPKREENGIVYDQREITVEDNQ